jgi:hypothetical protein
MVINGLKISKLPLGTKQRISKKLILQIIDSECRLIVLLINALLPITKPNRVNCWSAVHSMLTSLSYSVDEKRTITSLYHWYKTI